MIIIFVTIIIEIREMGRNLVYNIPWEGVAINNNWLII